eukprot:10527130-Heterocapsa_arctica.AAC.1
MPGGRPQAEAPNDFGSVAGSRGAWSRPSSLMSRYYRGGVHSLIYFRRPPGPRPRRSVPNPL